ncbi:MAG: hypothetical protein ACWA40_07010 [Planktomarina sp.]
MLLILLWGLTGSLGFLARLWYEAPLDRVQFAVHAFEKYCLPFAKGRLVDPDGRLVPYYYTPSDGIVWVDPKTTIALRYDIRSCEVYDVGVRLDSKDQKRFRGEASNLVNTNTVFEFKMFAPLTSLDWEEMHIWDTHEVGHPDRIVVIFSRFNSHDSITSQTHFTIAAQTAVYDWSDFGRLSLLKP